MTYSDFPESYKMASKKYRQEKVDSISFYVPKGKKAELKALAEKYDIQSVNALLNRCVDYLLEHPDILK